MEAFWTILFWAAAAVVLVWLIARSVQAGRGWGREEFTGSEPHVTETELEQHRRLWDRSREEEPDERP